MSSIPSIETPRLRIRQLTDDDFDFYFNLQSDAEVMRYIRPPEPDPEAVKARIAMLYQYAQDNPGLGSLVAEWKETGQLVASCVIRHVDFQPGNELELGYVIVPEFWGRGLATEIAEHLARYAFGQFGVDKVVAVVDPDNLPSQNVLRKCGFRHVGRRFIYGSDNFEFVLERPIIAEAG